MFGNQGFARIVTIETFTIDKNKRAQDTVDKIVFKKIPLRDTGVWGQKSE